MTQPAQVFTVPQPVERSFQWGDLVLIYAGVSLAVHTPLVLRGPDISLAPEVLPHYALRSVGRMAAAYLLSLVVALLYGRAAAEHRRAEQVLSPLLDVLQSVPILSFLLRLCYCPLSGGRAGHCQAAGRDEPGRRAPHAHGHAVVSLV
jgi:hypothetical protein